MFDLFGDIEVKPVLKWVGGKRELITDIREFYKNLIPNKYIEPFFGGGSFILIYSKQLVLN